MKADSIKSPFVATFVERDTDRTVLSRGRTGIVLGNGHKYVFVISHLDGWGVRIHKISQTDFEEDFQPAYAYADGKPDPERPYDVQEAARHFLERGSRAGVGITPIAEKYLNDLLHSKGIIMTQVEAGTASQTNDAAKTAAVAAKAAKDAKPAKKDAPKKSDKPTPRGHLAPLTKGEAKKFEAGKAEAATKSAKEEKAPAKGKKDAKPAKGAKEEKAPAKGKKDAKPAKGAKAEKTSNAGRPSGIDPSKTITVLVDGNPRREGTAAFENFKITRRYNGKTVQAYLDAGGRASMLRTDLDRKNIKLS